MVQSILLGLRWGYAIEGVAWLMPLVASTIPPLVWLSFGRLARLEAERERTRWFVHSLPVICVCLLATFWRAAIDPALIAIFGGYAVALARLARQGPDGLRDAQFERVVLAHRGLRVAAVVRVLAATVDALVALDFEWSRGEHAAAIVGSASVVWLIAVGYAASVAGSAQPTQRPNEQPGDDSVADGVTEVAERIDALMTERALFCDAELNLNSLAREARLLARQLSAAINRAHGKNVSQYVNDYRVELACRRLVETELQAAQIMYEAGFQTKSNFNREFKRVTGMRPMQWRARSGAHRSVRPDSDTGS